MRGQSIITTLAGTDWLFPSFSSLTKATDLPIGVVYGVAVDRNGNFYGGDCDNHFIFRIDTLGRYSIIAGSGQFGFTESGRLAVGARMSCPESLTFDRNDELLFLEGSLIRKLTKDGRLVTIGGGGKSTGENTQALLSLLDDDLTGLAADLSGNIYFSESASNRVRRVGTDGLIRAFAGTGAKGFAGDGGAAVGVATLERRSRRRDKGAADPVRCGIPNSDQSLPRDRWL